MRTAEAICRQLLAQRANHPEAIGMLANILRVTGRVPEGMALLQRGLEAHPNRADYFNQLCVMLQTVNQMERAMGAAQECIRRVPNSPVGYFQLGHMLRRMGQYSQAAEVLADGVNKCRRETELVSMLASTYANLGTYHTAVDLYHEIMPKVRSDLETASQYASALQGNGQLDDALAEYERLLKDAPNDPGVIAGKAETLISMSREPEALEILDAAMASGLRDPRLVFAFARACGKAKRQAEGISMLRECIATQSESMSGMFRSNAWKLLGSLLEKTGEYDEAFQAYDSGNKARTEDFDEQIAVNAAKELRQFFPVRNDDPPRSTIHSEKPVFILGMPRSGTSLLEQVLQCHPEVYGGGERDDLRIVSRQAAEILKKPGLHVPRDIEQLSSDQLDVLTQRYLDIINRLAPDASRVVDKNPFNFMTMGIIDRLVPHAHVIHCTRHPLDIIMSCFASRLSPKNSYANDLMQIAEVYRVYRGLMDHWKEVTQLKVLEVRYEKNVADLEGTTRKVLDFLGLEFDEACLRFHESDRHTRTASVDQVRQPLYTSSIGRHERFGSRLDPVREVLADFLAEEENA